MAQLENLNTTINQRIAKFNYDQLMETKALDRTHWDVANLAASLWYGLIKKPHHKWYLKDNSNNFVRVNKVYLVILITKTLLDLIMKFWKEEQSRTVYRKKLAQLYFDVKNAEFMKNVMYFLAGLV